MEDDYDQQVVGRNATMLPPGEEVQYLIKHKNHTFDSSISKIAQQMNFRKDNYDGTDTHSIMKSDEYIWRTRNMGQDTGTATADMLLRHRLRKIEGAKKSAYYSNLQIWHRIALLHYGDLLEIGLQF